MIKLLTETQKKLLVDSVIGYQSDGSTCVYNISYHLKSRKARPEEYRALENAMAELEVTGHCIMLTGGNYAVKTKLSHDALFKRLEVFLDPMFDFLSVIELHKPLTVMDPDM